MNQNQKNKRPEQPLSYVCSNCAQVNLIAECLKEKKLDKYPSISELGFVCPHCNQFQHSYFISETLVDKQRQMADLRGKAMAIEVHVAQHGNADGVAETAKELLRKYHRVVKNYQREFDSVNNTMRKKYGRVAPRSRRGVVNENTADTTN